MRHRKDEEEGIFGPVLPGWSSPIADLSPPSQGNTGVGLASIAYFIEVQDRREKGPLQ